MTEHDPHGFVAAWEQHLAQQTNKHPNALLKDIFDRGVSLAELFSEINKLFAVVKYGDGIVVANIVGKHLSFMSEQEFHKMLANMTYLDAKGKERKLSHSWFKWRFRRQYIGRGAVFEPGQTLEKPGDMINIFRGFAIEPAPGDCSLMKAHMLNVLCSGRRDIYEYLRGWMAWGVQNLDQPVGVAVALLGDQGAGKGIFARTFGSFFGEHFAHIANGDQLTGRFNASVGKSCFVFLDEAVWAGDKKGEGVLKALITEPTLQLEAKFKDPITVQNRLRVMVASNNDWAVPAGIGDRRWLILNVNNKFAGTKNSLYFAALHDEINRGGAAALLYELLNADLKGFNVRDVPRTAAKAEQQVLSLPSVEAWLYQVLQDGAIERDGTLGGVSREEWQPNGLIVQKDVAYEAYERFSRRRNEFRSSTKSVWSKKLLALLGRCVQPIRLVNDASRVRSFRFNDLPACRAQFAQSIGADLEWEPYQMSDSHGSGQRQEHTPSGSSSPAAVAGLHVASKLDAVKIAQIAKDVEAAENFIREGWGRDREH